MNTENLMIYAENILDYGVLSVLMIMSIVTLWLFIERMMYFKIIRVEDYNNRDVLEMDLTDNIGTIGAIGTNAPYVGLLGTILGIMITFNTIGTDIDTKQVMLGLALALKATAIGLLVAMPAIIAYTIILRKVEKILTIYDANQEKIQ